MTFVLRSTARTIVRCSAPSPLLATTGSTWRRSGRLKRTANVPSGRSRTGSPRKRDPGIRLRHAVDDQLGVDLELEVPLRTAARRGPERRPRPVPHRAVQLLLETSFRSPLASCSDEPAVMA